MLGVTPWLSGSVLALALALDVSTSASPDATESSSTVAAESDADEPASEFTPDPAAAAAAAARAQEHFAAEEWDQAIEALMEAYAADPKPAYLYARAQAERQRGNCRAAIALYERFLASEPSERQRADTQRHIRLCEEILFNEQVETQPDPTPKTAPPTAEPEPEPPVDEPPPTARPWQRDPLGLTLLIGGAGAFAAGATVWGLGDRDVRQAPGAATEEDYERTETQGRRRVIIGTSVAGAGVALIVGGALRLGLLSRRSTTTAAAFWRPGGGGLVVRGQF